MPLDALSLFEIQQTYNYNLTLFLRLYSKETPTFYALNIFNRKSKNLFHLILIPLFFLFFTISNTFFLILIIFDTTVFDAFHPASYATCCPVYLGLGLLVSDERHVAPFY